MSNRNTQQPSHYIDADRAKQTGYRAGQQLHKEKSNMTLSSLMIWINDHYRQDEIPMVLFSWYKEGVFEGYTGQPSFAEAIRCDLTKDADTIN
jgi:hypothetical protein